MYDTKIFFSLKLLSLADFSLFSSGRIGMVLPHPNQDLSGYFFSKVMQSFFPLMKNKCFFLVIQGLNLDTHTFV